MLVHLDFEGAPAYCWNGLGDLFWNSVNWTGLGNCASVEPIEEYSEVRAGSLNLTLTQVPNTTLADARETIYKGRLVEIHLALLVRDTHELIGVETLFRGTMDVLSIDRKPTSTTLKLTCVNELARLRDTEGWLYTAAHQAKLYPGDTGCRHVASIQDLKISL